MQRTDLNKAGYCSMLQFGIIMTNYRAWIPLIRAIIALLLTLSLLCTVPVASSSTGDSMTNGATALSVPTMSSIDISKNTPNTSDDAMNKEPTASKPNVRLLHRPPFLKHVTKEQIQYAIQFAEERHRHTVQRAISTYPVWQSKDQPSNNNSDTSYHINPSDVQLKEYPLLNDASNCLPDYGSVIPTTVYVTDPPILTREECANVIQNAEQYFLETNQGMWTRQKSGQYEVSGFDICDVPSVKEWFLRTAKEKLLPLLQHTFRDFCDVSLSSSTSSLTALSSTSSLTASSSSSSSDLLIDHAYLFKYTPETGRRTDIHTDSGCLSFTIALSSPDTDYDGGGTWFHGLHQNPDISSRSSNQIDDTIDTKTIQNKNVLSMDVGQITIRPGGVKHCGYAVTRGTRYIIGGFCIHQTRPEHVRMILQSVSSMSSSSTSSQEQKQQQLQLLEAAIVMNPGCTAAYNILANYHIENGNKVIAQQILDYCISHIEATSSEVAYSLASMYLEQKLYDKAFHCLSICLEVDPHDVEAMMMSATIASNVGDFDKEEQLYQDIIIIPDAKPSVKASAYCNLGVLHQGEELELRYYRQSLMCQPKTFSATYSLASALASRKRWSETIPLLKQLLLDLNDRQNNDTKPQHDVATSRSKSLRLLYTATMQLIKEQEDGTSNATSQDDVLRKFQDIMGQENFNELRVQGNQK
jgi:tetratricopeptide (TPR) repeat protein